MKNLFLGFLIISIISACSGEVKQPLSDFDYPEIQDLKLTGVITDIRVPKFPAFHSYGVISMDILESNVKFYDPRPKNERYPAVIEGGKSEFYIYAGGKSVGDTLYIDVASNEIKYYSKIFKKDITGKLYIYHKSFFDFIEEHDYQKL